MTSFNKSNTTESVAQQFLVEGNQCPLHQNVTIETLLDDVLLAIFTAYLSRSDEIDEWRTLVHVCQRWRYLVFASPGHLNLRLKCTTKTRAREMLGIWPPFPIVITDYSDLMSGVDNIIAALEQRDRVCQITLDEIPGSKMDAFVPAMLGPFPALEGILFAASNSEMAVVPNSFLGGSAPQLQWFTLHAIPFPALPTPFSSTRNLVDLQLSGIPRSGYISPEAMVTCLSAMPRLGSLRFQFDSRQSFPNLESQPHHPLERITLPALREFIFEGLDEYLEDLIARVDTPLIRELEITLFPRHTYHLSHLSRFIGRVEVFRSPAHAKIMIFNGQAEVSVSPRTWTGERVWLSLGISCNELDLQLQYFVQVCRYYLLSFSNAESLAISSVRQLHESQSQWGPTTLDFLWLDLLRLFSAAKVLDIDKNSLVPVAYTLKEVVEERITEVFPAIQELSIGEHLPSGPILGAIQKFATARELLTRPDRPHRWVAG